VGRGMILPQSLCSPNSTLGLSPDPPASASRPRRLKFTIWRLRQSSTAMLVMSRADLRFALASGAPTRALSRVAAKAGFCFALRLCFCVCLVSGRAVHLRSCFLLLSHHALFSPHSDGIVYLWHRQSHELLEKLKGHQAIVNDVSWHPSDPSCFASASDDHTVRIWSTVAELTAGEAARLTL
jgi:WD40 repeat protein